MQRLYKNKRCLVREKIKLNLEKFKDKIRMCVHIEQKVIYVKKWRKKAQHLIFVVMYSREQLFKLDWKLGIYVFFFPLNSFYFLCYVILHASWF